MWWCCVRLGVWGGSIEYVGDSLILLCGSAVKDKFV